MELINVPVPEPSLVKLLEIVGLAVVAQHTPRTVTADPPCELMVPPDVAVAAVMAVAAVVVSVASAEVPVMETSSIHTP